MTVQEHDRVRLLVDVRGFEDRVWPAGTEGVVVDISGSGDEQYYAVDVGEHQDEYDNIVLASDQFETIESSKHATTGHATDDKPSRTSSARAPTCRSRCA